MKKESANIYKTSRVSAGMTQDEACYHLGVANRTLAGYESAESRPPSDIVAKMMETYKDWLLGYKHMQGDPVGSMILQDIYLCENVAHCVIQCQKSVRDLQALEDTMIEVASDNRVDDHERKDWENILLKAKQMMATAMSMIIFPIGKEKRPLGAGTPNGPLVNQQSKYSTKKQFSPRI